jgi:NAD(P)H-hydrate epimerase
MQKMKRIDFDWIQNHTHTRSLDGHKKTFGHVLVIGGSPGKLGAAILTARAALHSGCGMVTAMIPSEAVQPLLSESPEIMYSTLSRVDELDLQQFDSIAIGPGLGFSEDAKYNVQWILTHYKGPVVIDADALTILSEYLHLLQPHHILTPHPGEFARLFSHPYDVNNRMILVDQFTQKHPTVLVLKGQETIVGALGYETMMNTTGNDGMASAGSGDVLTGIIAAICAQGYPCFDAACIGVFMHGAAGDIAIQHISKASLTASNLIYYLGKENWID